MEVGLNGSHFILLWGKSKPCNNECMNPWARKIEGFTTLPHKNISVHIQNTTPEEVETVLDAIAKDADWTYKDVKAKNGNKLITYQEK